LLYWCTINADVESCAGPRIWVVLATRAFLSSSYNLQTSNAFKDSSLLGCDSVDGCVVLGCDSVDGCVVLGCDSVDGCVVLGGDTDDGCVVLGCDTVLMGV
jgi:hypothetical protein